MAQKHIHFARTVREITNKSFKNKETKSQPSLKTGYLCHLLLLIPNKRLLVGNILKLIDSIKINFNLKTPSQQMHLYQKRVATGWWSQKMGNENKDDFKGRFQQVLWLGFVCFHLLVTRIMTDISGFFCLKDLLHLHSQSWFRYCFYTHTIC